MSDPIVFGTDLDGLQRMLVANKEERTCNRCYESYSIRENCEHSAFCDRCAQEFVSDGAPALIEQLLDARAQVECLEVASRATDLITALQAMPTEDVDYILCHLVEHTAPMVRLSRIEGELKTASAQVLELRQQVAELVEGGGDALCRYLRRQLDAERKGRIHLVNVLLAADNFLNTQMLDAGVERLLSSTKALKRLREATLAVSSYVAKDPSPPPGVPGADADSAVAKPREVAPIVAVAPDNPGGGSGLAFGTMHTCILTTTTLDGQPPPPCPACAADPDKFGVIGQTTTWGKK